MGVLSRDGVRPEREREKNRNVSYYGINYLYDIVFINKTEESPLLMFFYFLETFIGFL